MCNAVVWYGLRVTLIVDRNNIVPKTRYLVRSAYSRLGFGVGICRYGSRRVVCYSSKGWCFYRRIGSLCGKKYLESAYTIVTLVPRLWYAHFGICFNAKPNNLFLKNFLYQLHWKIFCRDRIFVNHENRDWWVAGAIETYETLQKKYWTSGSPACCTREWQAA